jgi:hypothetical protein
MIPRPVNSTRARPTAVTTADVASSSFFSRKSTNTGTSVADSTPPSSSS